MTESISNQAGLTLQVAEFVGEKLKTSTTIKNYYHKIIGLYIIRGIKSRKMIPSLKTTPCSATIS